MGGTGVEMEIDTQTAAMRRREKSRVQWYVERGRKRSKRARAEKSRGY
jgi:hypothetical protein